jgi:hypothetical protein
MIDKKNHRTKIAATAASDLPQREKRACGGGGFGQCHQLKKLYTSFPDTSIFFKKKFGGGLCI